MKCFFCNLIDPQEEGGIVTLRYYIDMPNPGMYYCVACIRKYYDEIELKPTSILNSLSIFEKVLYE